MSVWPGVVLLKRFCLTCGLETERYVGGKCRLCVKRRNAAWKKNNPKLLRKAAQYLESSHE